MGYANPQVRTTYTYPSHDFGAGAGAVSFQGPKNMVGKLKEIVLHCTETFTATTTPAYIRIGTASDADAYAEANLGLTADTDTFVASQDDPDAIIVSDLPADTQVEVAFIAPTGGTPAGIGTVSLVVEWY
jgi:hypothetical protein